MSKKFETFIAEGMKSYKKASEVAALFRGEVENVLKDILNSRNDYGPFKKQALKQSQSSKFWTEYPYINANVNGQFLGNTTTLRIAINWMHSDDYPIYQILFYDKAQRYNEEMKAFEWSENFTIEDDGTLTFVPTPADLNIKRDFTLLIDEFVRFLKTLNA